MKDKFAVVTGASTGIGRAVEKFAKGDTGDRKTIFESNRLEPIT